MKSQLNDLIKQGQIEVALQQLCSATPIDSNLHDDVLVVLARYQEWSRKKNLGVSEPAQERVEFNQLAASTVALIKRLPDGNGTVPSDVTATPAAAVEGQSSLNNSGGTPTAPASKSRKWGEIVLGIVAILGLVFTVLSYFNDRGIWPAKEETPTAAPLPGRDTLTVTPTTTVPKTEEVRPVESKPQTRTKDLAPPSTEQQKVDFKSGDIKDSKLIIGNGNKINQ